MRRLIFASILLLAACSSPTPVRETIAPTPAPTGPHQHNSVIGMTANELVQHFGTPRIQVRDGDGTKFQWIADNCVLDAYIYPPESGQGVPRVTYAEARSRSGGQTSVTTCATIVEAH